MEYRVGDYARYDFDDGERLMFEITARLNETLWEIVWLEGSSITSYPHKNETDYTNH
jgi:hypothetical protein